MGGVSHAFNISSWEREAGRSMSQSQTFLQTEFQYNQSYMEKLCLTKQKQKQKQKAN